jgi:transcriptional regulator with XRE-family HTH domain
MGAGDEGRDPRARASLIQEARHGPPGRDTDEVDVQKAGMDLHLGALGETLRALRLERGHTVGEVASGTGLSPSFLTLVEGGGSDISTGRLNRVAQFLGVRLGDLLNMSCAREVTILRAADRPAGPGEDGRRAHPLLDGRDDPAMRPALVELAPGASLAADPPGADGGELLVWVVAGAVALAAGPSEEHRLGAGDGAYLRTPPAGLRNDGDEPAVVLLVASRAAARAPARRPGGSGASGDGVPQVVEQA